MRPRSTRARSPAASTCSSTRPPRSPAAHLRPGEADEIRGRLTAAQHGEAIARGAATLREALTAGGRRARDDARPSRSSEARGLARLDPRFEPLADRLAGLEAELDDVADEARRLAEGVDHDPRAVAELDARLGVIHGLLRRYGDDEAAVIAHGERAAAEAERLRGLDEERARRQREDAELPGRGRHGRGRAVDGAPGRGGRTLGDRRRRSSSRSSGSRPACSRSRSAAGRPAPSEAAVEVDGDAVAFDATGIDQVVYRLAPNPGEPARPLARIASGGELSRVALAIKRVLAEADATPTLVFDEVDTRHRRPQRRPDRPEPVGSRPPPPGPVRHPPAPDRGACRRPLPDRQARARRPDRHRGRAARPTRAASSSSPRCSAAVRATRRRWPRRASCSTGPRRGGAGERPSARPAADRSA